MRAHLPSDDTVKGDELCFLLFDEPRASLIDAFGIPSGTVPLINLCLSMAVESALCILISIHREQTL